MSAFLKINSLSISLILLMLIGCSSTASIDDGAAKAEEVKYKGAFSEVTIDFSQEAENQLNSNNDLDLIEFNTVILDGLDSNGLINSNSKHSLNIIIDRVNIPSNSSSSYVNSLDLPGSISGILVVKDEERNTISQYKLLKNYESDISSAQKSDLIYRQFAEHISELLVEDSTSGGVENSQNTSDINQGNSGSTLLTFLAYIAFIAGFMAGF
ncbi:MAG: hypothetical protein ABW101_14310 [Candidatus Thiodiazotropha sp.]